MERSGEESSSEDLVATPVHPIVQQAFPVHVPHPSLAYKSSQDEEDEVEGAASSGEDIEVFPSLNPIPPPPFSLFHSLFLLSYLPSSPSVLFPLPSSSYLSSVGCS